MAKVTLRGAPLWLIALALIPLGVFFASLLLAVGLVVFALGAVALLGPLLGGRPATDSPLPRRRAREDRSDAIELDASEYRRIPDASDRDR